MSVIEARNPAAFSTGPLRELLDKATGSPEKSDYLIASLGKPWLTVLVALDPLPVGFVTILWPPSPLQPSPQAGHLWAANAKTRKTLSAAVVAAMQAKGYTKGLVVNSSGKDDAVYLRAFRGIGKPSRIASAFEFEFGPAPAEEKVDG